MTLAMCIENTQKRESISCTLISSALVKTLEFVNCYNNENKWWLLFLLFSSSPRPCVARTRNKKHTTSHLHASSLESVCGMLHSVLLSLSLWLEWTGRQHIYKQLLLPTEQLLLLLLHLIPLSRALEKKTMTLEETQENEEARNKMSVCVCRKNGHQWHTQSKEADECFDEFTSPPDHSWYCKSALFLELSSCLWCPRVPFSNFCARLSCPKMLQQTGGSVTSSPFSLSLPLLHLNLW